MRPWRNVFQLGVSLVDVAMKAHWAGGLPVHNQVCHQRGGDYL